jgi:hypothetical protein
VSGNGSGSRGGVLLLSVGGYRSGSTYAYNLLGEYVERANAGRRIGYVEPEQVPLLEGLWSVVEALGVAVGKAHHSPAIREGGAWDGLLAGGRLLPVCTLRDWRDVLHSFSRVYEQTPDEVLASRRWRINVDNVRWWLDRGALPLHYDDLLADPAAVLAGVVERAGLPYDDAAARAAGQAATPDRPAAPPLDSPLELRSTYGARFTDEGADPRTLLHSAHVATPAGGAWRRWDAGTLARVEAALAPLRAEFAGT